MQAVVYHEFGGPISIQRVADPTPHADGAVIRVEATGLCRSDWHGWRGHDADIKQLPHVPGHEFAGTVVEVGADVDHALVGQRVTMPFVAGCGTCAECHSGNPQVCDRQFQPGFTGWGSFAEYVAVRYAAKNLVPLPHDMTSAAAAALGCRMGTGYRAVVAQAQLQPGQWIVIFGCGGVGLSAVMIARALGARVIAIDIRDEPLALATKFGAEVVLNARSIADVPAAIIDLTRGGVHVSMDALGSNQTFLDAVRSLRKRGRHVQVGLMNEAKELPPSIIGQLIARELEIVGSHGIAAHSYPAMVELIRAGKIDPAALVERTAPLSDAPREIAALDDYRGCGVTVFTP